MADDNHVRRYLSLFRAALTDDWETAEGIFDQDPDADTARITLLGQTTLHIAVGTNSSHRFVEKLVNRIAAKDKSKLRTPDYLNNNSLHYAAKAGNTEAVKALLGEDADMALIGNQHGNTAVKLAASYGRKETLEYLWRVTPDESTGGEDGMSPYSGLAGGELITLTIADGFYDVATKLINKYPKLVMEKNKIGFTALQTLARQPSAFPSGRSWWFWKYFIYFCTPLNSKDLVNLKSEKKPASKLWRKTPSSGKEFFKSIFPAWFKYVSFGLYIMIWRVGQYLVPLLKKIHDTKLKHKQTDQLMKDMITAILNVGQHSVAGDVLGKALFIAAKHGIHELIEECLGCYPDLIWYKFEELDLFMAAIKYRQVKVFNLVYQTTGHVDFDVGNAIGVDNALHLVGRKACPHRLSTVTGAALQMQRELQWFKEVEKFVEPSHREALNAEMKTPRMVLIDEHTDLVEKGEKWMKDTASSSTLVATLIVTVSFAAIFTVPGGNKDNGIAYFLRDSTFILFVISDVLALFSAVTSVLMFLAMLTSRYAVDDFLYALPKRITIGLVSLFISIASIMVTFCAAIALVLREQFAWIALPVGLSACVPVTFFALLQFPLLVELVVSTYGPSIFHKQNNLMLH